MLANLKLEAVSYTKSNLTTVFSVLPVQEGGEGGEGGIGFLSDPPPSGLRLRLPNA